MVYVFPRMKNLLILLIDLSSSIKKPSITLDLMIFSARDTRVPPARCTKEGRDRKKNIYWLLSHALRLETLFLEIYIRSSGRRTSSCWT